ncbi:MAG: YybS family protein [Synergistaceae bacterium]|jgi:uncharacterized protein YybS (DUF2232 family)|nr:YybS family protein [Synergistaceae bacterium]
MQINSAQKVWIICTAAGYILFIIGTIMPVLSIPLMLIYLCPALLLSHERGLSRALTSGLVVSIAMTLILPPSFAVICFLAFWLPGTLLGVLSHRIKGHGELLVAGVTVCIAFKIAAAFAGWHLTGFNILAPDAAEMKSYIMAISGSGLSSLSGGDAMRFKDAVTETVNYTIMLIPYTMMAFSAAEAVVCLSLSSYVCARRGGTAFFSLPPFGNWSFPRNILLAFVVGFVCGMISEGDSGTYLVKQVGANLDAVTRSLFIIQGLSVIYHILGLNGVPKIMRIALVVLAPFISLAGNICVIVGIFDMGFDLRKRVGGKTR